MRIEENENLIVLLINKKEAQNLLNALVMTNAKGEDLDISMAIEDQLKMILHNV